jgi:prepilin-type N-terminal cleavage/methylation domain-containing protein
MGKLCTMTSMKRHTKGFTLIELLLACAILAYALSVILSTFIMTVELNEMSRNLITATTHLEAVLEEIRGTTFENVETAIGTGTWNWDTTEITNNGLAPLNSESIVTTSSGSNPLTVTVSVTWEDNRGRSRSKSLQTMISG